MPTRIDIELTSVGSDGSWTWRAAGAREPRGTLDGSILPEGASVGDQLKVESEKDVDGIRILSIVTPKQKGDREGLLELLPTADFEPVIQQRATQDRHEGGRGRPRRERSDRGDRGERTVATGATAVTATIAARSAIGLVLASAGATTETGRGVLTASGAATASAGTRDRISPRRPSSRSVRSQSASARASSVASKCSLGSRRSSALSPSWRCREWRRFDSGCARTTRVSRPRTNRRCPKPRCSGWLRTCSRSSAWPTGSIAPRPPSASSPISTSATCVASLRPLTIRWSCATSRLASSPPS